MGFLSDVGSVATNPALNLVTGGWAAMLGGVAAVPGILNGPGAPPPPDVAARDKASLLAAQQTALLNNP